MVPRRRRTSRANIHHIKPTEWVPLLLHGTATSTYLSGESVLQNAITGMLTYEATPIAGRFTPGAFTNQIQAAFREPRLLVVTDPRTDHQPVTEASYVNIPVIALTNTDSPLRYVDVAIPCNNKGVHSIGLMWWMLAREVLRLRGTISREVPWDVMVDLYFYRDPEEAEKDEQAAIEAKAAKEEQFTAPDWGPETATPQAPPPTKEDWAAESVAVAAVPIVAPSAGFTPAAPAAPAVAPKADDWSAAETGDWSAAPTSNEWGGGGAENWA